MSEQAIPGHNDPIWQEAIQKGAWGNGNLEFAVYRHYDDEHDAWQKDFFDTFPEALQCARDNENFVAFEIIRRPECVTIAFSRQSEGAYANTGAQAKERREHV